MESQSEIGQHSKTKLLSFSWTRRFFIRPSAFGENHIKSIAFPAHTRNLFQALDLVFFGVPKKQNESTTGENLVVTWIPDLKDIHIDSFVVLKLGQTFSGSHNVQFLMSPRVFRGKGR
jgi:hypothetical protein